MKKGTCIRAIAITNYNVKLKKANKKLISGKNDSMELQCTIFIFDESVELITFGFSGENLASRIRGPGFEPGWVQSLNKLTKISKTTIHNFLLQKHVKLVVFVNHLVVDLIVLLFLVSHVASFGDVAHFAFFTIITIRVAIGIRL